MTRMSEKRESKPGSDAQPSAKSDKERSPGSSIESEKAREIGGREGPEPTRFGDWEKNGRCIDF
jgi:hypothetical protein